MITICKMMLIIIRFGFAKSQTPYPKEITKELELYCFSANAKKNKHITKIQYI